MYVFGRNRAISKNVKQAQPEKEKAKLDFSWVPASSLGITMFTAVLFGAGKAYRQAYLSAFGFNDAFGVNDSAIPWSFQDLVYLGITKQLSILFFSPVVALVALPVLAVVVVIALWFRNRVAAKRRKSGGAATNKNLVRQEDSHNYALDLILFLVKYLGAVFLFALLALIFVAGAERLGKADAEKELAVIKARNTTTPAKPQLSYAIIERIVEKRLVTEEGYVVTCSDRACGLFMPDKGREASRLVTLDHLVSFRYVQ